MGLLYTTTVPLSLALAGSSHTMSPRHPHLHGKGVQGCHLLHALSRRKRENTCHTRRMDIIFGISPRGQHNQQIDPSTDQQAWPPANKPSPTNKPVRKKSKLCPTKRTKPYITFFGHPTRHLAQAPTNFRLWELPRVLLVKLILSLPNC